jgi:protein-tyrosine phosphatase
MTTSPRYTDIHCHLLPGIDDGAKSWAESLAMAKMAASDGIAAIVATPHQLGSYRHNAGAAIRNLTDQVQQLLSEHDIPLDVLPGADVRIEPDMLDGLRSGEVLTLADRGRHVLLELPHEMYISLEPVLAKLERFGMVGILSHPERNQGLLRQPQVVEKLVQHGCLMQITAGSLLGAFGRRSQEMCEHLIQEGLAHFVSTDAHSTKARRPLLSAAYTRTLELTNAAVADALFCDHPQCVLAGQDVPDVAWLRPKRSAGFRWFWQRKAA